MMADTEERRGLKPGQRHEGQFRKGYDPRRYVEHVRYQGLTIAQIARLHGPRAIELLTEAMDSSEVPWVTRLQAANALLDRGHGKPVSVIDMNVTSNRPLQDLSDDDLARIVSEQHPTVQSTVPELTEDLT